MNTARSIIVRLNMQFTFSDLCRGNGKIFIRLSASDIPENASITTCVTIDDTSEIPSTIVRLDETPINSDTFVITIPIMQAKKCRVDVKAASKEDGALAAISKSFDFLKIKWISRINYRFRPNISKLIRNQDEASSYESATFRFWDSIPCENGRILRGSCTIPQGLADPLSFQCINSAGERVEGKPISLGVASVSPEPEGPTLLEAQFSFVVPADFSRNYIFYIKNPDTGQFAGFDVLESQAFNQLTSDFDYLSRNAQIDPEYTKWFKGHVCPLGTLHLQRQKAMPPSDPLFSIIVPLYKTPEPFFNDMLNSVLQQTYGKWELVLVNASPEDSKLSNLASAAQSSDQRIKLVTMIENKGISENTNAGIEASTGDFICFFDHDDLLEPNLLFEYARAINKNPETDLLYCDEDKLMPDGKLAQPFFKPDFSIDLLRNNNYICHMLTIRKSLYDQLEPNTKEFDGAQDHNLTLQASEKARHIHHVPKVLYHWRISENSTAANADTKPYATEAGIRAVQNHLDRMGLKANVHQSRRPFTYTIKYAVPEDKPLVSIIVPTKDHIDLLSRCVDSIIDKSTYDNYEILLVENNSTNQATFDYYKAIEAKHPGIIRTVFWPAEFNFSKLMNFGAAQAKGDYLLLLNNDTEVITPDGIETMLGIAARPEVGIVGVRLYYPDDTIQHAGLCVTGSVAGHLGRNLPKGNWGYFALHDAEQNLSAVTAACMMTKREVFEKTRGWTEELSVAFNDVDFCLKAREEGYLVVYTPEVELYHYESVSRGQEDNAEKKIRFHKEVAYMNYRWAKYYVEGDPYINPNVSHGDPANCYYRLR